jgi:hypothetical protein
MSITEYVWEGRDNQFMLGFETVDDGASSVVDLSDVTSVLLELRNADGTDGPTVTVTNGDSPAVIDWWDVSLNVGQMVFKLGTWIDTFVYGEAYKARLTLTTGNSPNGIVWASYGESSLEPLSITVYET